jgi:hypothetical protein
MTDLSAGHRKEPNKPKKNATKELLAHGVFLPTLIPHPWLGLNFKLEVIELLHRLPSPELSCRNLSVHVAMSCVRFKKKVKHISYFTLF